VGSLFRARRKRGVSSAGIGGTVGPFPCRRNAREGGCTGCEAALYPSHLFGWELVEPDTIELCGAACDQGVAQPVSVAVGDCHAASDLGS
jgi:hypothetical protein